MSTNTSQGVDAPAYIQLRGLVEQLMDKGYLAYYKEDLYQHDRNRLMETAVPGAEYIYTVRNSGTHLSPIKLHPVSTNWAEAAVASAAQACEEQRYREKKAAEVCEFAILTTSGETRFINADIFEALTNGNEDLCEKLIQLGLGESMSVEGKGVVSRVRSPMAYSRFYPTPDWDEPMDHKVFHIIVQDDLSAKIREISPQDAKHLLVHPSPWEVRKLEGGHRSTAIGSELVITYRGDDIAKFHMSSHDGGVYIDAELFDKAKSKPELIPSLVQIIKDEVTLQQNSLFFHINDASIDQKPLDDVLSDALVKVYQSKLGANMKNQDSDTEDDLLSRPVDRDNGPALG